MKKHTSTLFLLLIFLLPNFTNSQNSANQLKDLFGATNVEAVDSTVFKEYYLINVPQYIDHDNKSKGQFLQRVRIGIVNKNAINVMLTEGYDIPRMHMSPDFKMEVTNLLTANQIIIEHRYFGASIPDSLTKKYLTYKQASADFHYIKEKLKSLLQNKWITTGVSKSGDAALAYRYYYPNDVAATLVYGISLTTVAEEPRIEKFFDSKRNTEQGKLINQAQLYLLEHKSTLLPLFQKIFEIEKQDLTPWDIEVLYDYGVLDLENSFWQYYKSMDDFKRELKEVIEMETQRDEYKLVEIPANPEDRLVFFAAYSAIGNIVNKMKSHYYQAFSQGGYYGYNEKPFLPYLKLADYPLSIFAGEKTTFDPEFRKKEKIWAETSMQNVILINGTNDPWSVCKIIPSTKKDNLVISVENANHSLRLEDLPSQQMAEVKSKLSKWLDIKPF